MRDIAAVLLNNLREMTPRAFHHLLKLIPDPALAVSEGPGVWGEKIGLDASTIEGLRSEWRQRGEGAKREVEECQKRGISLVWWKDADYPWRLREISFPPPLLYRRGKWENRPPMIVSVVGTRRPTYYGEKIARVLCRDLTHLGVGTVSGMARGIDKAVHDETLLAGGWTAAVLGSGLNQVYPPEHKKLAERITEAGVIMSEFGLDTKPFPGNFPRRNRIVSALTMGTVVVEGTLKSGSLITARLAASQGREVFAVPGPVFSPLSEAPHFLISQGAKLTSRGSDVVEELWPQLELENKFESSSKPEKDVKFKGILEFLGHAPVPKEAVCEKFGLRPEDFARILLDMEMSGRVKSLPGGYLLKLS